jgi:hypothetical protein
VGKKTCPPYFDYKTAWSECRAVAEKVGMRGIQVIDFILLTPTLSSRRGSAQNKQLFIFVALKTP